MERYVDASSGARLWAQETPGPGAPLLLVMDADAPGPAWPDELVARLAEHHRVLRYDHRDTGRSTRVDDVSYAVTDLAADAVAVLDAFDVPRAHLVGTGLGGTLVQLLLLDRPERIRTATLLCTAALGTAPDPDPALTRLWAEIDDPRDDRSELAWRVEHRRLLHGTGTPFDPFAARALEQRLIAHAGHCEPGSAHARAGRAGLDRGAELAGVRVPVLVIEAPDDPVHPPPHAEHLADALGCELVRVDGLGRTLPEPLIPPLAEAILSHTARAAPAPTRRVRHLAE